MGRELLNGMAGSWEGTYRLWLEPDVLASESPTHAEGELIVRDTLVLLRYDWTMGDERHEGTMMLACPSDDTHEMAWGDSFHYGTGILWSTGGADAVVLGTYAAGDQQGQWRTGFAMPDPDHLVVTAWNIWQEHDYKATEATYERVTS